MLLQIFKHGFHFIAYPAIQVHFPVEFQNTLELLTFGVVVLNLFYIYKDSLANCRTI